VKSETIGIIPYTINVDYDFWSYHDIMNAILPEDSMDEIPSGFQLVGHVGQ
jgi:tRNA (guanine37-N1)-methyltransferase